LQTPRNFYPPDLCDIQPMRSQNSFGDIGWGLVPYSVAFVRAGEKFISHTIKGTVLTEILAESRKLTLHTVWDLKRVDLTRHTFGSVRSQQLVSGQVIANHQIRCISACLCGRQRLLAPVHIVILLVMLHLVHMVMFATCICCGEKCKMCSKNSAARPSSFHIAGHCRFYRA